MSGRYESWRPSWVFRIDPAGTADSAAAGGVTFALKRAVVAPVGVAAGFAPGAEASPVPVVAGVTAGAAAGAFGTVPVAVRAPPVGAGLVPSGARIAIEESDDTVTVRVVSEVRGPGGLFRFLPSVEVDGEAIAAQEAR